MPILDIGIDIFASIARVACDRMPLVGEFYAFVDELSERRERRRQACLLAEVVQDQCGVDRPWSGQVLTAQNSSAKRLGLSPEQAIYTIGDPPQGQLAKAADEAIA